ncbi:MAG TPA: hypothetical protein VIJ52_04125 [Pseudolabrys sp.]
MSRRKRTERPRERTPDFNVGVALTVILEDEADEPAKEISKKRNPEAV